MSKVDLSPYRELWNSKGFRSNSPSIDLSPFNESWISSKGYRHLIGYRNSNISTLII